MEPTTIIVAALIAGAAAAAKDTASEALKDAFNGIKARIRHCFQDRRSTDVAMEELEKDPDMWEQRLTKAVTDCGLDRNEEILEMAHRLLELVKAEAPNSSKYAINIDRAQGTVIGDSASVTQYFDDRSKGEKA